ncbi:MAG TPA: RDD family protein [Flavipsychrobacter sp.]
MENQYHPNMAEGQHVQYAGFWARVAAFIIDALILMLPKLLITFLIDGRFFNASGWTNIVTLVVDWLYFAGLESGANQATIGKRLLDIMVVDVNGNRIGFWRATGRYFSKILSAIILLIGFIMVGFDTRKQGLHDKIADTFVVSNGSF